MKQTSTVRSLGVAASFAVACVGLLAASDWPEYRGPARDGRSTETGLPEKWSPSGDNLAWRAPYGGRSGPIVVGNRVYLQNSVGDEKTTQERLMCLDADTGKPIWERRFSIYLSDVPQHRAGWASPAADPETGSIYVFTVGAELIALSRDGKVLWSRSLVEDFGAITTHGGRTVSPIVDGPNVIVNTLNFGWGDLARTSNRYFAFDKRTGQTVWISSPQQRHYDTNYAMPVTAEVNGMRLLVVGGTDGVIHAIKAGTGEPVWRWDVSKRAINNSVVIRGTTVYVTHSEENIDTSEMGMVAAIDASANGDVGPSHIKWVTRGFLGGFASPVYDGARLYHLDNGAVVGAFDLESGRKAWDKNLGTIQKGSPVLADGKIYVGTENGKFFILRPRADGVDVLDEDWLGTQQNPEPIIASPAVADGRVYVVSMSAMYAIGKRRATGSTRLQPRPDEASLKARATGAGNGETTLEGRAAGAPAKILVFPYDVVLAPGTRQAFTARLFDANGTFIREEIAEWSLEQLGGTIGPDGIYRATVDTPQAGTVKATAAGLSGTGRVRVIPPLPYTYDFESWQGEAPPRHWIHANTRYTVRDLGGTKGLFRPTDNSVARRVKTFLGPSDLHDYTVEADFRVMERRRQMGDVGVIAQRYAVVLFGNSQRVELHPWQAADEMTVRASFAWKADTWYRVKLRVENRPNGTTVARGKAWPASEPEPSGWLVEKVDAIPHRLGAPGIYTDAGSDISVDNIKVYRNQ
ncbi:MAG: PQQ-binding-like beta-propeller repeat protein [Vicinamibacterales bacterium]